MATGHGRLAGLLPLPLHTCVSQPVLAQLVVAAMATKQVGGGEDWLHFHRGPVEDTRCVVKLYYTTTLVLIVQSQQGKQG